MKIIRFRDKKEKIRVILGAICFLPSFLISMATGVINHNIILGLGIMLVTQFLWLTSIELCCWSLDIENRQLKKKIKELEGGK